jgi:cysteinyl-tRNA synthetase
MTLRVYNTLTQQKEEFRPLRGRRVNMFVCGITPYDSTHVGHARTYVAMDVVARYLRYKGYRVFYLQNVTDIEDKIIRRAVEKGTTEAALAAHYFREYEEAMASLGIGSVNLYAWATDYVPEIVEQVQGLVAKGYAYELDGDVYYEVAKFQGFGRLSKVKREALEPGARVAVDERKRDPQDFALWKSQKPGEPAWDSPWGPGRPGWHIEDTAISIHHFGPQYDLHGGGNDLIFPHHEAEIAQAEAFTGITPFVKYWVHTGWLNIQGEKMSKSLANIVVVKDLLKRYPAPVVRFFLLNVHYRSPLDFTEEGLEEARRALSRLAEAQGNLEAALREGRAEGPGGPDLERASDALLRAFEEAMDDDFNTREAMAALFTFAGAVNQALARGAGLGALRKARGALASVDSVLGILGGEGSNEEVQGLLDLLSEIREEARKRKDYATSDRIREGLLRAGYALEDTPSGPRWKRKAP